MDDTREEGSDMEADHRYVFISYSSRNYEAARELKDFLNINNIDCWMAPLSIPAGSDYAKEIPKAIGGCSAFLLMLTAQAQASEWVFKELDRAIKKKRTIIPFQLDDAELSDPFDFALCNVQRIMAHGRYEAAVRELLQRMGGLAVNVHQEKQEEKSSPSKNGGIHYARIDNSIPSMTACGAVHFAAYSCGRVLQSDDFLFDEKIEQVFSNSSNAAISPLEERIASRKGRRFMDALLRTDLEESSSYEPLDVELYGCSLGKHFSFANLPGVTTFVYELYNMYDYHTRSRYLSLRQLDSLESEDRSHTIYYLDEPHMYNCLCFVSFKKDTTDGYEIYLNGGILTDYQVVMPKASKLFRVKSWYLPEEINRSEQLNASTYDTEHMSEDILKKLSTQLPSQEAEWVETDLRKAPAIVLDPEKAAHVLREVYYNEEEQALKARIKIVPYKGYLVFRLLDDNRSAAIPLEDAELGYLYRSGLHGFPKDLLEAIRHFEKDGSPDSLYQIAGIFATEEDLYDNEMYLEYLQMAADIGAESAISELAEYLAQNDDEESVQRAKELFCGVADSRSTIGNFLYACCMEKGMFGTADSRTIFDHYLKAALNEYQPALARLRCTATDLQNPDAIYPHFLESIETGSSNVDYCLGCIYFCGFGIHQRKQEGLNLLHKAADRGDQQSAYALYSIYDKDPVYRDKEKSRLIAMEKLSPKEKNKLANRLIDDTCCDCKAEKDAFAFALIQKSADSGSISAIHNLGWMYRHGRGCTADYGKAMQLFEQAKRANSFFFMGDMYEKGLGVEADINKAVELYDIASSKGSRLAKKRLEELKNVENSQ